MRVESNRRRRSTLPTFLRLVAVFACGVGVYSVFIEHDVFAGMTTVWLGGMMLVLSTMVDA